MVSQFKLTIENGKATKTEGFFFKAAPFTITQDNKTLTCVFELNKHKEAVLSIYLDKTKVLELEHPFYIPDETPEMFFNQQESLKSLYLALFHALIQLEIAKPKLYLNYIESQTDFLPSYSVAQARFYEATTS